MSATVVIDFLPESVRLYREQYAIIAVDVIRTTTTAISGVVTGRRCFPVPSFEAALPLAAKLDQPLLVGELGGNMPYGFDLTNSPARVAARTDVQRPMILISTSGTRLIHEAASANATYLACLRNYGAAAGHVVGRHQRVAVIGAGTRGEFREEDQMCCALVAMELTQAGYVCEDRNTATILDRWLDAPLDAWTESKSVTYLRNTQQLEDLDFILSHIQDLSAAFVLKHDEIVLIPAEDN